jgi:hypothetical protein
VAELANMRRIITVSNLQLKANLKSDNPNNTMSAEFTASAYSLNSSAPAPSGNAKEDSNRAHKPS